MATKHQRNPSKPKLEVVPRTPLSVGRTDTHGNVVYSGILLSLPDDEYDALLPHLEFIEFRLHQRLHESPDGLEYGYFLNFGLTSLVIVINDGIVGTPIAAGLNRTPYGACVQADGNGFRIKAEVLEVILSSTPNLRLRLNQYAQIQAMQVAQLAACNRLHEIDQRLARWLLMCQDRICSDLLPMTHEFFAEMLGTGRPSVSLAAAVLQRAGFIQYARGTVKIINRKGLEEAACECYGVIQQLGDNPSISPNILA
ncbi:MAG: Crp/Fnr family transcriptional regulator [Acidobacteria bacterium]|nr:MAG: Crp/Fnr family transcriptional regulator [Acidobacteriota bacterium]